MERDLNVLRALFKTRDSRTDERITHSPMAALCLTSVTARIFYLIVIDMPQLLNAGWLAAVMGAGLAFPAIFACCILMKKTQSPLSEGLKRTLGNTGYRMIACILALILTYETAAVFTMLTSSGAYATLYNMHKLLLMIPTSLSVIYVCLKGGNGIGGAAQVWLRIYLVLYAVILYLEYGTANFSYVFPILGPGLPTLWGVSFRISGYFCLIPISMMVETGYRVYGQGDKRKVPAHSILILFLLSVLITALLLIIHSAMYPSFEAVKATRSMGMDMMLSNGRSNQAVQLPILIIWFSALALCAGHMLYCAGRLMNDALGEKGRKCTFLAGIIALVITLFRMSDQKRMLAFLGLIGPFECILFLVIPLASLLIKAKRGYK